MPHTCFSTPHGIMKNPSDVPLTVPPMSGAGTAGPMADLDLFDFSKDERGDLARVRHVGAALDNA
jgi:hypothetical protein